MQKYPRLPFIETRTQSSLRSLVYPRARPRGGFDLTVPLVLVTLVAIRGVNGDMQHSLNDDSELAYTGYSNKKV